MLSALTDRKFTGPACPAKTLSGCSATPEDAVRGAFELSDDAVRVRALVEGEGLTAGRIVTQFGSVPVPWTDLSNDCIFAMGQSFLRAALPPDKLADRAWYLGVFAFFNNKDKEGRELLIQASQTKAEYLDQLTLFIGTTETQ